MKSLDMHDAGFNIGVNVRLRKLDKNTGRVLAERQGHNRCLKMQLLGLIKWLNGEFNPSQSYLISYDWIPRYLGLGTNIAVGGDVISTITSEVTVNDTRLLNEISPRIKLPDRNKVISRSTQDYVQLIISTYIPENLYNGQTIAEAGLFSQPTGNNCLFRIAFEGIPKTEDSVIEVTWTISIISIDSKNQPYEPVEKADLKLAIDSLLNKFSELYPNLKKACDDIKNEGIYMYARTDASQNEVDKATLKLTSDLNELSKS